MKLFFISVFAGILFVSSTQCQPKATPEKIPAAVPVKEVIQAGTPGERSFASRAFGFELTFPEMWTIAGEDFEKQIKEKGIDLSLKAPDSLPAAQRTRVDTALKNVDVLFTAYRSMPGSADNAIVRVSAEDLSPHPQIKDAVDYFDAIRASYAAMKVPPDFTYSDTQAEKLGAMQFGFLDITSRAGKKRMYATVRRGHAIQFTLTYKKAEDLAAFRKVLADGNFRLK